MEKVSDVVDDRDFKPIPFDIFAPWANLLAKIKVPDNAMSELQFWNLLMCNCVGTLHLDTT